MDTFLYCSLLHHQDPQAEDTLSVAELWIWSLCLGSATCLGAGLYNAAKCLGLMLEKHLPQSIKVAAKPTPRAFSLQH